MKKSNISKRFLEELAKTSNISIACEKLNISRQTIYRWKENDTKFNDKINQAIYYGNESINDLAESKLVQHLKSGNMRAIQYWLGNHKGNYLRPRPSDFWSNIHELNKTTNGSMFIINEDGGCEYTGKLNGKKYKIKLDENDPILKELIEKYGSTVIKMTDFSDPNDTII